MTPATAGTAASSAVGTAAAKEVSPAWRALVGECSAPGEFGVRTPPATPRPPWRKIAIGVGRKTKEPAARLAPAWRVLPRLARCEKTYLLFPPPLVVEEGAFLVPFLWPFLLLEVLLPLAGVAGVVCANATVEATAKAIAIRLFFILFYSPRRAFCRPPHSFIMRLVRPNLDSPGRLRQAPNSGAGRLSLLHECGAESISGTPAARCVPNGTKNALEVAALERGMRICSDIMGGR